MRTRFEVRIPCTLVAVLLCAAAPAQLEVPPPDTKFLPPLDPASHFGQAVDTDGTVLAAISFGQVAIYARTAPWPTWKLQDAQLLFEDTGSAVAVDGERVIVGEFLVSSYVTGVARVFRRSGAEWLEEAVLEPAGGQPGEEFGTSVDIDGTTLVVGAPGHGTGGAAYVFTRDAAGWTQRAVLQASDAAPGDAFGTSVSLSGELVAVGAYAVDAGSLLNSGAVYVFAGAGASWIQEQRLEDPATPEPSGNFGLAVAVDGDTLLAGAPHADAPGVPDSGGAWAFVRSGGAWTPQALLVSPDAQAADGAGRSVALDGDRAVSGAPAADDVGFGLTDSGKLQIFERAAGTWSHVDDLTSPTLDDHGAMGWSVGLGGDTRVGGAPLAFEGSVHVFSVGLDVPVWLDLGYGLPGTIGAPRLQGSGALAAGTPGALDLDLAGPAAPLLAFVSLAETATPFKGGTLTALPPVLAFGGATSPAGEWRLEWSAFPAGVPPYTAFLVQVAVADAGGPKGVALSNVVAGTAQP